MNKISVIIVAAGNATRMGGIDKQFIKLKNKPVILHSIEKLSKIDDVYEIVVVTKKENFTKIHSLCKNITKPVIFAQGGNTRQESVLNGINKCSDKTNFVAIHDGARPLVTTTSICEVFADAYKYNAATLGVISKDTIKVVDEYGFIQLTPNRETLYITQTPQVFKKALYLNAIENAKKDAMEYTDDCQLVESMGIKVFMTVGEYSNIKITTPEDVLVAKVLDKSGD